jgi:starch phosphorylase
MHARTIYSTLENDIVPLYYEGAEEELPLEWVRRMKTCLANITPHFSCGRMVAEYMNILYKPAHHLWENISGNNFKSAREKTTWDNRLHRSWDAIRFLDFGSGPDDHVMSGSAVPLRTTVDLAGLEPSEVRVEAVIGQVGTNGTLQHTFVLPLQPLDGQGSTVTFANEFTVAQTGRIGYSVRITPNHFDKPITRPCNALLKWHFDEDAVLRR